MEASGERRAAVTVSGVIELESDITHTNGHANLDLTNAPPGGLVTKHYGYHIFGAQNVTIKHMKFARGLTTYGSSLAIGRGAKDIALENCTALLSRDDPLTIYNESGYAQMQRVSLVNCMVGQGIDYPGESGKCMIIGQTSDATGLGTREIGLYLNLFYNAKDRCPLLTGSSGSTPALWVYALNNLFANGARASEVRWNVFMALVRNIRLRGVNGYTGETWKLDPHDLAHALASTLYFFENEDWNEDTAGSIAAADYNCGGGAGSDGTCYNFAESSEGLIPTAYSAWTMLTTAQAYANILANAGARPGGAVDVRLKSILDDMAAGCLVPYLTDIDVLDQDWIDLTTVPT